MSITIEEIAKRTGFSVSTISRVLNHKSKRYRISSETELKILNVAKEEGYRPNDLARGLRLQKTHLIGLVVPDISNPFFAYVTHIIQKYAYQSGYSILVANTNEDINTEIEQIELFRRKKVDGFIIMPVGTRHEHISDLLLHNRPLVLLDRNIDQVDANCVVVDNYKGAYEGVHHLINCGHVRIAIIQGLLNTYTNNERIRGYKDALADSGISVEEELIIGNDFRSANGYISTKMLLKMNNPPTAIFTFSDLITLGSLQAIDEEKIKIPNDLSLLAFDDFDFAPHLTVPLSTVRQPRELMGEAAVKLLIDEIEAKEKSAVKKKIVLDPKVIIRESVKNLMVQKLNLGQNVLMGIE